MQDRIAVALSGLLLRVRNLRKSNKYLTPSLYFTFFGFGIFSYAFGLGALFCFLVFGLLLPSPAP